MTDHQAVLEYIDNYWETCTFNTAKTRITSPRNIVMRAGSVSLPNPVVSPNHLYFAGTQFYWDTYFTILGLIDSGRVELARGMVDNLLYLFKKFELFPARNSWTSRGRTQPPFMTRMAIEIYVAKGADDAWLDDAMKIAQKEYESVWKQGDRYDLRTGLSRYAPKYFRHHLAVFESGWDLSSRFSSEHDLLPVDLNSLLYQYEADFLLWAKKRKNQRAITKWTKALAARKKAMDKYLWDEEDGFYYDYCPGTDKKIKSLAGYFPLWCKAASKSQATRCINQLSVFEQAGGLASTEKILSSKKQWDYPNGWPPLQLIALLGIAQYGKNAEAERIAQKWLTCNQKVYKKTGKLWEKYDVVDLAVGKPGRYPTQEGFAWTNAVYVRLCKLFKL